jgi:hypothetical protein
MENPCPIAQTCAKAKQRKSGHMNDWMWARQRLAWVVSMCVMRAALAKAARSANKAAAP